MTSTSFPERLRFKRKDRKFTQAELAVRMAVTPQAVSQWETGQSGATHESVLKLAGILGVDWEWLGYGADVPDPNNMVPEIMLVNPPDSGAPVSTLAEVAQWARKFPETDVQIWDYFDTIAKRTEVQNEYEVVSARFEPFGILIVTFIEDYSMDPDIKIGDIVIFDTKVSPEPGDIVISIINEHVNEAVVRKLKSKTDSSGQLLMELVPINTDFPTHTLVAGAGGRILATLVEHHRFRAQRARDSRRPLKMAKVYDSSDT